MGSLSKVTCLLPVPMSSEMRVISTFSTSRARSLRPIAFLPRSWAATMVSKETFWGMIPWLANTVIS